MRIKQYPILDFSVKAAAVERNLEDHKHDERVARSALEPCEVITIDVEQVKAVAFEEGKKFATSLIDQKQQELQESLGKTVLAVHEQLSALAADVDEFKLACVQDSVSLCLAITKKVVGDVLNRESLTAVQSFLSQYLPTLYSEPKITIKVEAQHVEKIEHYIAKFKESGHIQDVVLRVIADQNLTDGGCILEFDGNEVRKDRNEILLEIEKVLRGAVC